MSLLMVAGVGSPNHTDHCSDETLEHIDILLSRRPLADGRLHQQGLQAESQCGQFLLELVHWRHLRIPRASIPAESYVHGLHDLVATLLYRLDSQHAAGSGSH